MLVRKNRENAKERKKTVLLLARRASSTARKAEKPMIILSPAGKACSGSSKSLGAFLRKTTSTATVVVTIAQAVSETAKTTANIHTYTHAHNKTPTESYRTRSPREKPPRRHFRSSNKTQATAYVLKCHHKNNIWATLSMPLVTASIMYLV